MIEELVKPQLLAAMLAALAVFATVVGITMPMLRKDRREERMKAMALERDRLRAARAIQPRDQGPRLRRNNKTMMGEVVNLLGVRERFDTEQLRQQLKMAGLRGQAPVVTFMFFRIAMPPAVTLGALFYLFVVMHDLPYSPGAKFCLSLILGGIGYYLPNLFLQNMISKRQQAIGTTFPDALDMLLICVQAGMSVEAAFGKVAREIGSQSIELAEELSLTTAELSYLPERRQAFENLGKRIGLPGVKAVATALIQAERYGTPVSQALRTMAQENREMRTAAAEKKAAALPPKLTVPMIVFFLPVLFVVVLGPAILQVMKLV